MNEIHLQLCASPEWARYVEEELLPWALAGRGLGDDVLELGPGPGLTTDVLRRKVTRLTAVEVDDDLAGRLAARLAGTNVDVVHADATASSLPTDRFTAATCFTMLHHVPTPELQDALFREVRRVLRPGGGFLATDALDGPAIRSLHVDDIFVPVDPETIGTRLQTAGFSDVEVEVVDDGIRFTAVAR